MPVVKKTNKRLLTLGTIVGSILVLIISLYSYSFYKFALFKPSEALLERKVEHILTIFQSDGIDINKIEKVTAYYDSKSDDYYYDINVKQEPYRYECKIRRIYGMFTVEETGEVSCWIINADMDNIPEIEGLLLYRYLNNYYYGD